MRSGFPWGEEGGRRSKLSESEVGWVRWCKQNRLFGGKDWVRMKDGYDRSRSELQGWLELYCEC